MGCDVHFNVEVKTENGWRRLEDPLRPCFSCEGTGKDKNADKKEPIKKDEDGNALKPGACYWCKGTGKRQEEYYEGRNYDLFAVLAGVRDYGQKRPVVEPRGFPADASPEVKEKFDGWGADAHTPTHFTLEEMLRFDWNGICGHSSGIVSLAQYKEFKKTGKEPNAYCQGIGGPNVKIIDSGDLDSKLMLQGFAPQLTDGFDPEKYDYHTRISWNLTYKDAAGQQWMELLSELKDIADKQSIAYKSMRMVFWFDN